MRRRQLFIAVATALLTFITLQAFVGDRYRAPFGHRYHHGYRYDDDRREGRSYNSRERRYDEPWHRSPSRGSNNADSSWR